MMNGPTTAGLRRDATFAIITYCASSIFMTLINKYVVSGSNFNLNFFLLFVQVCKLTTDLAQMMQA